MSPKLPRSTEQAAVWIADTTPSYSIPSIVCCSELHLNAQPSVGIPAR